MRFFRDKTDNISLISCIYLPLPPEKVQFFFRHFPQGSTSVPSVRNRQ